MPNSSDDSELLAVYIAEGIARNGSPEFAKFMEDLHAGLRERSKEIFDLLLAQENSLGADPFIYQMTLNLAAKLALPNEFKAQLLGHAMGIPFTMDPATGQTYWCQFERCRHIGGCRNRNVFVRIM